MKYLYALMYYFALPYWFIRRPQTHGSGVILSKGSMVLLVRHTYGHRNLWYFPGGKSKHGETPVNTALRELKEEVGVTVELKLLGTIHSEEDWRNQTDTYFIGNIDNQDIRKDKKEILEYKWWPIDKLPQQLSLTAVVAINLYLTKVHTDQ